MQLAAHNSNSPISCTAICKDTEMPDRYLLQILHGLVNAGLVTSRRGVQGGYVLAKPANKISIWEVHEAIAHPADGDAQFNGLTTNSQKILKDAYFNVDADMRKRLSAVTIADLQAAKL